jgi:hypothetical protein
MGNKALRYGFMLIAAYLAFYYYQGVASDINNGTKGTATVVKAFQGR